MFVNVGQTVHGMKQRHGLLAGACGKPDKEKRQGRLQKS